uniref:Viral A-type inclusion protein n=1 Tax=Caenorhabditis tropicalis TaxID=1561998 RepID=A0A1I7UGG1_9PELO
MVFDKWFGPSKEEVEKELDKEREEAAKKNERENDISVEYFKNDTSAEAHREKMELERNKEKEKQAIRNETKNKIEDLSQQAYIKKMELSKKAEKEKVKCLWEEEQRRKQLEEEHRKMARDQQNKTEGLRKNQEDTANERNQIHMLNSVEAIKQAKDTEVLRNKLSDDQRALTERQQQEFHEKERQVHEKQLKWEKKVADKEEKTHQKIEDQTVQFSRDKNNLSQNFLQARVCQAENDERKVVNAEVDKVKQLTSQLKNYTEEVSAELESMNDDTKHSIDEKLGLINKELDKLSATLLQLEKKSAKLPDLEAKAFFSQVKAVKGLINKAKTESTAIKRELKPSATKFDMAKGTIFNSRITEIVDKIDEFKYLNVSDHQITSIFVKEQEPMKKEINN